ncbi:MAG: hypothetical protein DIU82_11750, partial [Bacillota bacterium]
MYGLPLIVILILLGGFIAYLGDRVGMRVGRQRLTLFGLRPKHTSVIITIATGILIVAASLAVLSIASEEVRTALFRMREIQEALATTRLQYEGVVEELARQRAELERTQAQRDAATQELAVVEERLQRIGTEYEQAVAALQEAQENLEFTQQRVSNLQQIGEELQRRIEEMQGRIAEMEAEIEVLETQIRAANLQLDIVRGGELAFQAGDIVLAEVIEGGAPQPEIEEKLLALLERADLLAVQRGARLPGAQPPTALQLPDGVFEGAALILAGSSQR